MSIKTEKFLPFTRPHIKHALLLTVAKFFLIGGFLFTLILDTLYILKRGKSIALLPYLFFFATFACFVIYFFIFLFVFSIRKVQFSFFKKSFIAILISVILVLIFQFFLLPFLKFDLDQNKIYMLIVTPITIFLFFLSVSFFAYSFDSWKNLENERFPKKETPNRSDERRKEIN